jgi:hypothetical protein
VARIVIGTYLIRFPVGGYFSWMLQWLVGFRALGHEAYLVEKSGWPDSCYDPLRDAMGDDCSYGTRALHHFLARFGLQDRWCFVDAEGHYHGLSRPQVRELFRTADLFVDMGMQEWRAEAAQTGKRVLVDGEPGFTQMKWASRLAAGKPLPQYDFYFTVGMNVGRPGCAVPTAGKPWRGIHDPVCVELFPSRPAPADAPFTTVTSWQAHDTIEFEGRTFGQKDTEFAKFLDLPRRTVAPLELALGGRGSEHAPTERLRQCGWRVRNALDATVTFDAFRDYLVASRGEFAVCKNVFVATRCGCFSERSAAYLASGRPVVMQDTGFSDHLPCGQGLFAVRTVEEAAAALDAIQGAYECHSRAAREVAQECLDAAKVLKKFLNEVGL